MEQVVNIYTDGACSCNKVNEGFGGWAVVIVNPDGTVEKLGGFKVATTNNRMELKAVLQAFREIIKRKIEDSVIHMDSSYVFNAITLRWIESWRMNHWLTMAKRQEVQNRDLWEEVIEARAEIKKAGYKCRLHKVKGHANVEYNETADVVAKEWVGKAKEFEQC